MWPWARRRTEMGELLFPWFLGGFLSVWLAYLAALCWSSRRTWRRAEAEEHGPMERALREIAQQADQSWASVADGGGQLQVSAQAAFEP